MKYAITQTRLLYVYSIDDKVHRGLLKVGEVFVDNATAQGDAAALEAAVRADLDARSYMQGVTYKLEFVESTTYGNPYCYKARKVHDCLKNSGVKYQELGSYSVTINGTKYTNKADTWFECDLRTVKRAIAAVKAGHKTFNGTDSQVKQSAIVFRPEQNAAIDATVRHFCTDKGTKFLWNAKMRFGKTLCGLEVARKMGELKGYKTTLIVTHRPVVDKGWRDDFNKIFGSDPEYVYATRMEEEADGDYYAIMRQVRRGEKKLVFFVSMQYLRLSTLVGGKNDDPLKRDIMEYDWDLVLIDEAHEGTESVMGKRVIEQLRKERTRVLSLSGTPFNLLDSYSEKEIYTWDYVMEQRAKLDWKDKHFGDPNPYADLPRMQILTFTLSQMLQEKIDDKSVFKFHEFFRVWTGNPKDDGKKVSEAEVGHFVHEEAVKQWLNRMCATSQTSMYPFSTPEFRRHFRHSFWLMPGVREAAALQTILEAHPVFKNFKVVNVAGDANMEDPNGKALREVETAIKTNKYTITLSCGKLTTGVTVPEWTAVLNMKGGENTPAANYMQTIFRVQSTAELEGRQKRECYVFDFAPDRALIAVAETAKMTADATGGRGSDYKKTQKGEEEQLQSFLQLCPVISMDGAQMGRHFSANQLFQKLNNVYIERAVRSGYSDNSLYNVESLMNLSDEQKKELDEAHKIIGKTKPNWKVEPIDVTKSGLSEEERKKAEEDDKKQRGQDKKEPTEAQKKRAEENREKLNRISVMRGIAIRIPLLVYGAEMKTDADGKEEPITIDNFTDIVDPASWEEFMPKGVTKRMFNSLKTVFDRSVFTGAASRIREMVREADNLSIEDRIAKIAEIFKNFHNPDKETVLTPWRVVNMQLSDTLGGYCFFNDRFDGPAQTENEYGELVDTPRLVCRGEVSEKYPDGRITDEVFADYYSRVLEINSKTGLYPLYMAYSLFKLAKEPAFRSHTLTGQRGLFTDEEEYTDQVRGDQEIWEDVLQDNIFVVCRTRMAASITRRTLAGFRKVKMNVKCYEKTLPVNQLVKAGVLKRDLFGVTQNGRDYLLNGKDEMKCELIDVLRTDPKIFEREVVQGRSFWHVYNSIPTKPNENINNMKFTAVVGNPPYQIQTAKRDTTNGQKAVTNVFHLFQIASQNVGKYTSLIYPGGRWIHRSGKGLGQFGLEQINDPHLLQVILYADSSELFDKADLSDGITAVLKDASRKENSFEYIYKENGVTQSIWLNHPGEKLLPLNPYDAEIVKEIEDGVKKHGFTYMHDSILPRSLFSIESDFVERNPNLVREYNEGDSFNPSTEIKLLTNDKAGKAGRARWYIANRNVITSGLQYLDRWKVIVSSANAGGQKRSNQIEVIDNLSAFGRSRVALKTFATKKEADNFFKYANSGLIRFAFLMTDEALSSLALKVPDLGDYSDSNGFIDYSGDVDSQVYDLFGIKPEYRKYIKDLLAKR